MAKHGMDGSDTSQGDIYDRVIGIRVHHVDKGRDNVVAAETFSTLQVWRSILCVYFSKIIS